MSLNDLPSRHNYVLALRQCDFEPLLAEWVLGDLAVPIERKCDAAGLSQDACGVSLDLADGRTLRSQFLVGCDGGRSLIRRAAGFTTTESRPTRSWIVAEADTDDEPKPGTRYTSAGLHGMQRIGAGRPVRMVLTEHSCRRGEPTIRELREALVAAYGTDLGLRRVQWMSRFTDATRLAATFRDRRVLLAGDAAHTHPPQGGQGLNTGLQDAVNLGWKLATVVHGRTDDTLLDTYDAERRPVAARVIDNTLAQVALTSGAAHQQALRDWITDIATVDEVRHRTMAMLCALDVRYDMNDGSGDAHPLVGRRMPDLDLDTDAGRIRLFDLLRRAEPVLVDFTGTNRGKVELNCDDTVRVVAAARQNGPCRLPVVGDVEPAPAVLIRPDGHVAWTGHPTDPGLRRAAERWFGTRPAQARDTPHTSTNRERSG
jgi:3-(3-hydroxy-phenyl)propionate hydroxylase